jgi:hypothetical protein
LENFLFFDGSASRPFWFIGIATEAIVSNRPKRAKLKILIYIFRAANMLDAATKGIKRAKRPAARGCEI